MHRIRPLYPQAVVHSTTAYSTAIAPWRPAFQRSGSCSWPPGSSKGHVALCTATTLYNRPTTRDSNSNGRMLFSGFSWQLRMLGGHGPMRRPMRQSPMDSWILLTSTPPDHLALFRPVLECCVMHPLPNPPGARCTICRGREFGCRDPLTALQALQVASRAQTCRTLRAWCSPYKASCATTEPGVPKWYPIFVPADRFRGWCSCDSFNSA